ncbi:hypothetical protein [Streptomyces sp. NPDC098781]|uniref:hypothetical protein n=1 Tax=Streptomyces sp. NPDC098781 TaxID=3366097 RepID=UPI003825AFB7
MRVPRTAAGRHALQLALLVGGLLAIGFLCGERAYAADGVSAGVPSASHSTVSADPGSPAQDVVGRLLHAPARLVGGAHDEPTTPPAEPGRDSAPQVRPPKTHEDQADGPRADGPQAHGPHAQAPQAAAGTTPANPSPHRILSPVTDHVTHPVGTQLVQPVGDVVRTVTEDLVAGLAEVQAKVPPLSALPSLPTAPEAPAWPDWPGLEFPELPALPEVPDVPGADLPALPGRTLPAPVTGTPQPVPDAPAPVDGRGDKGRTGEGAAVAHGPRFVADIGGVAAAHAPVAGGGHRLSPSGYAPAHQAPADQPGGAVGSHAAGDSGTPRHGDAHAVSLNRRVPLGLVPGAAARAYADEVGDVHRDIPVSPA